MPKSDEANSSTESPNNCENKLCENKLYLTLKRIEEESVGENAREIGTSSNLSTGMPYIRGQ